MAGLLDLFGGSDPFDIYGDIGLSEKQRSAIQGRGLLSMAGALADAAMPSRMPVPLGAAIGKAASALGGGQDQEVMTALKAQQLRQEQQILQQASPYVRWLVQQYLGTSGPSTAAPGGGGIPTAAAPAASGGGGGIPTAGAPAAPDSIPSVLSPPDLRIPNFGVPSQGPLNPLYGIPARPGADGVSMNTLDVPLGPQQQAGLLGAPDQVVGQQNPYLGLLAAALAGGGGGSGSPFQLASASAPGGSSPPGGDNRTLDLIEKYESGGRNIMQGVVPPGGGYNPSVGRVTGPSTAQGYYQITNSTWRDTAPQAGVDLQQYPTAMSAPKEVQKAVAQELLDTRGTSPWAPYNPTLRAALGGQDTVIPSGRGLPTSMLRNVADTGGGGAGPPAPSGATIGGVDPRGLAALNALLKMGGMKSDPFGSLLETFYKSPEYLEQAAGAQAKGRITVEEPFEQRKKMLDLMIDMRKQGFFVDPNTGQVTEDPQYAGIIDRRKERTETIQLDFQKRLKTFEEQIEIQKEARGDKREVVSAPVMGQGGTVGEETMTRAEKLRRLQDQSMRPGDYKPGDIVAKPIGAPTTGYQYKVSPQGAVSEAPIPGTPAEREVREITRKQAASDRNLQISRDVVVQNADQIESLMATSTFPITGGVGSFLSKLPGTAANDARVLIDTIKSRSSLDALNAMRNASPTGGALGAVSDQDAALLRNAVSNLEQSQSQGQFLFNLRRLKQQYVDAIHGPGAYSQMTDQPVMPMPSAAPPGGGTVGIDKAAYDKLPSGSPYTAPDGSRRIKP